MNGRMDEMQKAYTEITPKEMIGSFWSLIAYFSAR